jgi:hypothetical protein
MPVQALYKYGSMGKHTQALLTTPAIWFSAPSGLNDPFECRPWFTFEGSSEQFLDVFRTIARKQFPEADAHFVEAQAQRLLSEGRHKDEALWDRFRTDVVRMLGNRIGICCLSMRNDNILMWSHYADDHKGFCLEFEATDYTPVFGTAQQVLYADSFPVVDFFNTPHDVQVDQIFLTKYAGWQYEEEYRIIDHERGPGSHEYPIGLLRSVTFGLRTPPEDKAQIREWLRQRGTSVQIYQARIHDRDFKILVSAAE